MACPCCRPCPCGRQPCSRVAQSPDSCQDDQRKAARISQFSQAGRRFPGLFIAAAGGGAGQPRSCQRPRGFDGVVAQEIQSLLRPMPSPALVSFLGVPGWGPLHLELAASADPPGLARRLRRARASAGLAGSPAVLLAAFLRQERDLQPLLRPWGYLPAGGRFRSHRFRICAGGEILSLRVTAWCWHGPHLPRQSAGWRTAPSRSIACYP